MDIRDLSWPQSRFAEALEELARRAGLKPASGETFALPTDLRNASAAALEPWLAFAGTRLGLETEAVECAVPECDDVLRNAGPAILRLDSHDGARLFLVLRTRLGRLHLIGPDLRMHHCPVGLLRDALCARHEGPLTLEIDRLMSTAQVPSRRWDGVRATMLRERLATQQVQCGWILRVPASRGFWFQLKQAQIPRKVSLMLSLFGVVYGLEILGWVLIGEAALNGRLDLGWMSAWLLLVLSIIPIKVVGGWLDATFGLEAGRLLKRRLLNGALSMNLDAVRKLGTGQLLGRVMESGALESLALNGGLAVLVAAVELLVAAVVLSKGAAGTVHLLLLTAWLGATVWWSWRYYQKLQAWTLTRLDMTHELIERMVGHRTCLAQEQPGRREAHEDQGLKGYLTESKALDRAIVPAVSGVPAGWMLLSLIGLAPVYVAGTGTPVGLAIALGGILLAHRAFSGITGGLSSLSRAAIAWKQVGTLFHVNETTAASTYAPPPPGSVPPRTSGNLIDASGLTFRYGEGDPVLRGLDLSIAHGDRILLEGSSGGGKSTLASLLTGLRRPSGGLLLLNGLDRHTLGESWHQHATEAPQFHENHILTGSLGFNLLMGRNWPATEEDLEEARQLCIELGLGDLLERMPAGLQQRVGETGWQLSHGERSRIFLARALLQNAQLTILDESFAALDPETLQKCLHCAFRRARTLMVIAHP